MVQRMRLAAASAGVLLAAVLAAPAGAQETNGYPLKTFLGLTDFDDVVVAPDGRQVAFIASSEDFESDRTESAVYRLPIGESGRPGEALRLTYEPGSYSGLAWSPDSRRLAFLSTRGDLEGAQLFLLDMRGGEPRRLTDPEQFKKGVAAFDWLPDGGLVFAAPVSRGEEEEKEWKDLYADAKVLPGRTPHTAFWRMSIGDGDSEDFDSLTAIEMSVTEMKVAPDGMRTAFVSGPPTEPEPFFDDFSVSEIYLLANEKGAEARRLTRNLIAEDGLLWSRDGQALYAGALGEPDAEHTIWTQGRIYRFDAQSGAAERLAGGFEGSLSAPEGVLPDGRLLATGALSTRENLYVIDGTGRRIEQVSDYAGQVIAPSTSRDARVVAFALVTDGAYPELYVAQGATRAAEGRQATRLNAAIDTLPKPEVEAISWANGEGDTVEGVLYWPPGRRGASGLPLIVDIHGGPWSLRTESIALNGGAWAYYPALLASRGYLVLEPNYRGGTGRGDEFLHAIEGHSCSRPATDILAGVDHLVERGWADSERMGVMGYSYGGVLTNCLIVRTDRFDAAASGAGIWNDISYFGTADNFVQNIVRNLNRPPWEAFEEYWKESAASGAGNISTPTIITIGGADRRVPTPQGYELYRTLTWLDVPSRLLVFPGEPHGFRKPAHKLAKVRAEIEWLDRYVLGQPPATRE